MRTYHYSLKRRDELKEVQNGKNKISKKALLLLKDIIEHIGRDEEFDFQDVKDIRTIDNRRSKADGFPNICSYNYDIINYGLEFINPNTEQLIEDFKNNKIAIKWKILKEEKTIHVPYYNSYDLLELIYAGFVERESKNIYKITLTGLACICEKYFLDDWKILTCIDDP